MKVSHETGSEANFGFGRALMPSCLEMLPPKAAFFSFRMQPKCGTQDSLFFWNSLSLNPWLKTLIPSLWIFQLFWFGLLVIFLKISPHLFLKSDQMNCVPRLCKVTSINWFKTHLKITNKKNKFKQASKKDTKHQKSSPLMLLNPYDSLLIIEIMFLCPP